RHAPLGRAASRERRHVGRLRLRRRTHHLAALRRRGARSALTLLSNQQEKRSIHMDPILILVLGIALLIGLIIVLRVNAFIALICAAIFVSLLAPGDMAVKISRVAEAFGGVVGSIGIVIALAAVIGKCLQDSGAADRIVRSLMKAFGVERAPFALMTSGFVLSIPVF